jgi:hypothetical protein
MMSAPSLRRSLVVTVAVLLLGAPAAGGATHRVWQATVNDGPLVAGSHTIWTEIASITALNDPRNGRMPALVQDLGPDGRVTTMYTTRDPSCDTVSLKAASSRLVVVRVIHTDRLPTECARATLDDAEILAAPPGRPLAALQIDPDHCPPQAMALDASRMAILSAECPGRELAVFDLDSGARLGGVAIDYRLIQGDGSLGLLALAGDHVALLTGFFAPKVVEFDWRAATQELEVAAPAEIERLDTGDQLAAGPDGTVVAGFPINGAPFAPPKVIWASPAAPTAHPIDSGLRMFRPQLVDGLIPAAATGHRQFAARPRRPRPRRPRPLQRGRRLRRAERLPDDGHGCRHLPGRRGPLRAHAQRHDPQRGLAVGTGRDPRRTSPRSPHRIAATASGCRRDRPAVSLRRPSHDPRQLGRAARAEQDRGGHRPRRRLRQARNGRRGPDTLSPGDRQRTSAQRAPAGGHCAPTRFIDATGIATWRLRLARRLPSAATPSSPGGVPATAIAAPPPSSASVCADLHPASVAASKSPVW